jgi:D-threonate/D-erythronate kinase
VVHEPILVLADDLTGALEVGAKFAAAGVESIARTAASISAQDFHGARGALVVDTETRHLSGAEAAERIRQVARAACDQGFAIVFKKTDSTLRGNIGPELAALVEVYSSSPLLYVPAYPKLGRMVRNGSLYVDGVLVSGTCFAHDALNPVRESHIPSLISGQSSAKVQAGAIAELLHVPAGTIAVCDGETDAEVEFAANAFLRSPTFKLAAGPSSLADHIARDVDIRRGAPPILPKVQSALIINGSLHEASIRQVEQAVNCDFAVVDGADATMASARGWTILKPQDAISADSLEFARKLAESVRQVLVRSSIDLLVIFGGDTAYAIIETLGHPALYPMGEVLEGIPISRIRASELRPVLGSRDRDLYVITKAGGFGSPHVLSEIRHLVGEG